MSKYRIYELAKDLNTTSKVIIDILARNNITAKNHMSSIDEDAKVVIDRTFARKTGAPEPAPAPRKEPVVNNKPETVPVSAVRPAAPARPAGDQTAPPQRPMNGDQQQQPRPPYQQGQGQQQRPPYQQGQGQQPRPPYQQGQGQQPRPPYQQGQGQQPRPPYQQSQGQQPRPPYQQGQGQQPRPPYQQGQGQQPRPPYQQGQGQQPRPPYQQGQGQQPRPPYQQGGQQQQRPPYQQGQGQQPRPPYQQQGGQQQQRPPYQQGQPGARPQGGAAGAASPQSRPQGGGFGQRPPQGGAGARPGGNRPNNSFGGRRPGPGQRPGHHRSAGGPAQQNLPKPEPIRPKSIRMGESLTVKELAGKMSREVSEIIKKLMLLGVMATINQEIDFETATILAAEFGVTVEELPPEEDPTEIAEIEDDPKDLLPRPPVVTVMGHVDHGKTSVLDVIRKTNVTASEAGGITQHIGAYQVMCQGKKIVFLDTPGHEAFTAMRARGAQATDIAILVVAADDGVMPQTIEAINHSKSAKVPIIVAINKMDREGANPERVKQQLSEHGLIPEDWGGDTIMVPVSAHQKTGLKELLEMILLVAEMQDLRANPNRLAYGTIIEAELDKGRGPVATVLVQKGTLHVGDTIIAGTAFGKVRAMINDRGEKVKKAEPSTPVEVLGLSDVPQAGDTLVAVDERTARNIAEKRVAKKRTEDMKQAQKVSLEDLFQQIQDGQIKDLNIVVKADVQGSIEALRQSLVNLKNKEVRVNIIHSGVGAINESDVMLASASNALIIGFNVRPDSNARKFADSEKVDIRMYRVIYEALNDVEAAITGMLAPEYKEVILGKAEVRQLISVPKAIIAGSYVLEGKITSTSQVRVLRDSIVIHEGKLESLRRFKDDVKEVAQGYECGISIEKFRDIKEGDIVEAFMMELVPQKGSSGNN
ncbi:MAG TPA: translation initiation factor IF-2 [Patescibacteria group bacterium]|nr:translation initiation factor IF-2 [Patescibacteria group bacterium]